MKASELAKDLVSEKYATMERYFVKSDWGMHPKHVEEYVTARLLEFGLLMEEKFEKKK